MYYYWQQPTCKSDVIVDALLDDTQLATELADKPWWIRLYRYLTGKGCLQ